MGLLARMDVMMKPRALLPFAPTVAAVVILAPSILPAAGCAGLDVGGESRAGTAGHACAGPAFFDGASDVVSYAFDGDFGKHFSDHPAWRSEEATIEQADGVARLSATGTGISEAWKVWRSTLPYDRSWKISVTVVVPSEWESTRTDGRDEPQVGAGPWVGILDEEGKGRRVYEVNLAAIAGRFRFVQGQLIQNRLGEDPIRVGHIRGVPESVRLHLIYCAADHTISLYCFDRHVDTQAIDENGADDWGMSAGDSFYAGIMGFAEWTDLERNAVALDDFEVSIRRTSQEGERQGGVAVAEGKPDVARVDHEAG